MTKDEIDKAMEQVAKEAGHEPCELCSNENWNVRHAPGKCPKQKKDESNDD